MLLENTSIIFKKASHAAMRAGRNPGDIKIIAVTKTVSIEMIREAVNVGLRMFGENRIQEAEKKITNEELRNTNNIEWHFIGHLQKNKAKYAVKLFDVIQTVDSIDLAIELNRLAEKAGKVQRVLAQVKLSEEESKHGTSEDELRPLLDKIRELRNLKLEGLMTIPPYFDDPQQARPYFRRLREIRDNMEKAGFKLPELSMGMSNDFEVAIEEGATMVRIGSAIFGERA